MGGVIVLAPHSSRVQASERRRVPAASTGVLIGATTSATTFIAAGSDSRARLTNDFSVNASDFCVALTAPQKKNPPKMAGFPCQ